MNAVVGVVVAAAANADLTARRARVERARLAELIALRRAARASGAAGAGGPLPRDQMRPGAPRRSN